MNGGEEIVVSFVVLGCDGSEVFDLAEKAFDAIALAIEDGIEGQKTFSRRHGADVGHRPSGSEAFARNQPLL